MALSQDWSAGYKVPRRPPLPGLSALSLPLLTLSRILKGQPSPLLQLTCTLCASRRSPTQRAAICLLSQALAAHHRGRVGVAQASMSFQHFTPLFLSLRETHHHHLCGEMRRPSSTDFRPFLVALYQASVTQHAGPVLSTPVRSLVTSGASTLRNKLVTSKYGLFANSDHRDQKIYIPLLTSSWNGSCGPLPCSEFHRKYFCKNPSSMSTQRTGKASRHVGYN